MQIDLWQRRLGWLSLVGVIFFSGALAQSKFATAEDAATTPPPESSDVVFETQEIAVPGDNPGEARKVQITRARALDMQKLAPLALQLTGVTGLETGKFWIGVECREPQPELRTQLGLDDGQGLVVVHVAEESPAAKAGIKQHDVVVSAGEAKLGHSQDLVKAVEATDGKEITLKIIRAGKEKMVQVTPGERPKDQIQFIARPGMGMVFPGGAPAPLPDNVSVSISRSGKQPAKISVSRGDEKWDINDQELNKLPDDLRPFVERMLGGGPMTINLQNAPNAAWNRWLSAPQIRIDGQAQQYFQPQAPGAPNQPGVAPPPAGVPGPPTPRFQSRGEPGPSMEVPPDVAKRLEDIDRQLQRLQDELRRIRENGPPPPRDPSGQPRRQGRED